MFRDACPAGSRKSSEIRVVLASKLVVPDTNIQRPSMTAQAQPIRASNMDPDEMSCRMARILHRRAGR
jgi:hypothetical protein